MSKSRRSPRADGCPPATASSLPSGENFRSLTAPRTLVSNFDRLGGREVPDGDAAIAADGEELAVRAERDRGDRRQRADGQRQFERAREIRGFGKRGLRGERDGSLRIASAGAATTVPASASFGFVPSGAPAATQLRMMSIVGRRERVGVERHGPLLVLRRSAA